VTTNNRPKHSWAALLNLRVLNLNWRQQGTQQQQQHQPGGPHLTSAGRYTPSRRRSRILNSSYSSQNCCVLLPCARTAADAKHVVTVCAAGCSCVGTFGRRLGRQILDRGECGVLCW
jgi:hypothetical protein